MALALTQLQAMYGSLAPIAVSWGAPGSGRPNQRKTRKLCRQNFSNIKKLGRKVCR